VVKNNSQYLWPWRQSVVTSLHISRASELKNLSVGDITASAEVSRQEVDGPEFDSRIQGGVLVSCNQGIFLRADIDNYP
jgi:hypothetical protein